MKGDCQEARMPQASYGIFEVETFEFRAGLWHARVLRSDHQPVILDGELFEFLHTDMSWPNAKPRIWKLNQSSTG